MTRTTTGRQWALPWSDSLQLQLERRFGTPLREGLLQQVERQRDEDVDEPAHEGPEARSELERAEGRRAGALRREGDEPLLLHRWPERLDGLREAGTDGLRVGPVGAREVVLEPTPVGPAGVRRGERGRQLRVRLEVGHERTA